MTAVQRLFFLSVMLLVITPGAVAAGAGGIQKVDELIGRLGQGDWQDAVDSLVQIGEPAVEPLISTLQDRNIKTWIIHARAANALAKIGSQQAVEALADDDWMVSDQAAVALTKIESQKVIELLAEALTNMTGHAREQAVWITNKIKLNKTVKEEPKPHKTLEKKPPDKIYCGQKVYPCYPATLDAKPDIPSPHTTLKGEEIVTAFTKDAKYALVPVTVENGKPLDYKQNKWGKGLQLQVDATDFPALARTGLHSEGELNRTKIITGRSIVEIIELGRPGRSSGAGFMSNDEDIISVLQGDNHLVKQLGLKHPQIARPLYHIWNMILIDVELNRLGRFWEHFEYILYNGQKVSVKAESSKGWQESIFEDEILGKFQIQIQREPNQHEKAFLREKYPNLTKDQMATLLHKLSHLHISEMAPYYIMRYGFYEGHTDYRADPIAIAWIFGIRSLEEIEASFPGRLPGVMTQHFTRHELVRN
jgi:hypothetical protein